MRYGFVVASNKHRRIETMRTRSLVKLAALSCAITLVCIAYVGADQSAQKEPAAKTELVAPPSTDAPVRAPEKIRTFITHEEKVTYITGSYIPRKVKRVGLIQDSPYHLVVYDREFIQRSGAQNLAQFLARDPAITVRGLR
jgi:hypothetical protein